MIKDTSYLQKILVISVAFIASHSSQAEESRLNIATVNYPLQFFTESIAGKEADVNLPMPSDIDPAFWSPDAQAVSALQKADMVMLNGANYAKWLPKVSLSLFKQVNTSAQFKDQYIPISAGLKHNHGVGGEHSHTGTAFTTWLNFSLAAKQADAVFNALSKKLPDSSATFEQNFKPLQQSLLAIDTELTQLGVKLNGKALLGSHPVYQYLKKHYQLNLQSVHWEPEEAPTEAQWKALKEILKTHPSQWMLWEGKPAQETVAKLEAIGVKSIVFSPCANTPETGDFLTVMQQNVKALKTVLPSDK
jgi:zinc transport system substrate-binding protein